MSRFCQKQIPKDWQISDSVLWHSDASARIPSPVPSQSTANIQRGVFRFLNQTAEPDPDSRWECKQLPRLWQYNLHYFDWLWSLTDSDSGYEIAKNYVVDWIQNHRVSGVSTGWEPYPTSLRLMNWMLLFLGPCKERTQKDSSFMRVLVESLYLQSCFLSKQLEFHILANHLLENATALALTGFFFKGADATKWGRVGNSISRTQLDEQILSDGLHFERSPMYHARILWLTKLLSVYGDDSTKGMAGSLLPKMDYALSRMRHPDSSLALFNDAANEIYSLPVHVNSEPEVWALKQAGYYGATLENGNYIVCDCGNVGPDYQPGHAHADTFSFEWTIDHRPFITDTGTFEYGNTYERSIDRSTKAHNTLTIGGRNSSEVWSSFRVGQRCYPRVTKWSPTSDSFFLEAEHDGYSPWVCRRSFAYDKNHLEVCDFIQGRGTQNFESNLHFAPGVQLSINGDTCIATVGDIKVQIVVGTKEELKLNRFSSRYSPEFGLAIARESLSIQGRCSESAQIKMTMMVQR
jgi:uncharacterized heparinase superfamily protein